MLIEEFLVLFKSIFIVMYNVYCVFKQNCNATVTLHFTYQSANNTELKFVVNVFIDIIRFNSKISKA